MGKARTGAKPKMESHIAEKIVENPLWMRQHDGETSNVRFITATVNTRESAISVLVAKKAISEHQAEAAGKFRILFETMGGSGARGIDTTREFVEGGRFPDPIGVNQIDAGKKLSKAYHVLTEAHGLYAWRLVGYICGEGRSVHELTETRRQRDTMTDNLRAYLDCLALHWGLINRLPPRERSVSETD